MRIIPKTEFIEMLQAHPMTEVCEQDTATLFNSYGDEWYYDGCVGWEKVTDNTQLRRDYINHYQEIRGGLT